MLPSDPQPPTPNPDGDLTSCPTSYPPGPSSTSSTSFPQAARLQAGLARCAACTIARVAQAHPSTFPTKITAGGGKRSCVHHIVHHVVCMAGGGQARSVPRLVAVGVGVDVDIGHTGPKLQSTRLAVSVAMNGMGTDG